VFYAPDVGSYVGGDITAGLLCTPVLRETDKISLFIDAGTNGELVIGNSSLFGAYLILLNEANREMVQNLAKKMTYIELNTEPGYMFEYMGALFLPHTNLNLFPSVEKILNRPL